MHWQLGDLPAREVGLGNKPLSDPRGENYRGRFGAREGVFTGTCARSCGEIVHTRAAS